ncbi:MAG TPA: asparagine synthase-related protein, partial [Polyangiaceae bacterium]|nr:asparagine synthase-related protein [Polyangiaceae bacterium]
VPRKLFERPKSGFGIPVGDWVRGPLRDWAEDLLAPGRVRGLGLLDEDRISTLWKNHVEGRSNSASSVWTVLMFQAWLASQTAEPSAPRPKGVPVDVAQGA